MATRFTTSQGQSLGMFAKGKEGKKFFASKEEWELLINLDLSESIEADNSTMIGTVAELLAEISSDRCSTANADDLKAWKCKEGDSAATRTKTEKITFITESGDIIEKEKITR